MPTLEKLKLGEVIDFIDGDRGINYPSQGEFSQDGECLFLTTKNVPSNKFSFEEKNFISTEKSSKMGKGKLQRGDYILTTRGTVGNFAHYDKNIPYDNIRINSGMVILRKKTDTLDEKYFQYYLFSNSFSRQVKARVSGSAQPQLPIRDMLSMEILLPNLKTQVSIASVLSAYDDLIENNEKRIRTLEEMTQRLYTEWFVKFKFPGHEKAKMDESGTKFGVIPEGWEVKNFIDHKVFSCCKDRIKKFEGNKLYFDTSCIDGIKITKSPLIVNWDTIPSRAQFSPVYNSVWFARMSNTYKVLAFDKFSDFEVNNYLLSSGMLGLTTGEKYLGFLFALIKSEKFHKQKNLMATGATQVSLTDDGLSAIKVLFPSVQLIEKYSNVVNGYIGQILSLQRQNNNLSETRDLLIPQLVTGKRELK